MYTIIRFRDSLKTYHSWHNKQSSPPPRVKYVHFHPSFCSDNKTRLITMYGWTSRRTSPRNSHIVINN